MNHQSSEAPFFLHEANKVLAKSLGKSLGFLGTCNFHTLLETKVIYFILVKYTCLYMCKAHAESFVQLAEESCNNVSYLQRQKLPAKVGEK